MQAASPFRSARTKLCRPASYPLSYSAPHADGERALRRAAHEAQRAVVGERHVPLGAVRVLVLPDMEALDCLYVRGEQVTAPAEAPEDAAALRVQLLDR